MRAARAAWIAGIPRALVRVLPTDAAFRLRADAVRDAIAADRAAGLVPMAVVASAGTSGSNGTRFCVVTARARNLPPFRCCIAGSSVANPLGECPPSRSVIKGPEPLYGTCTMSTWVSIFSHSPAK